jgi:hypothetical protein
MSVSEKLPPESTARARHPKPRLRVALNTLERVSRMTSRVIREMRAGTLPTQEGARIVNALHLLCGMLKDVDLERRLTAVEKRLGQRF